jgi:hypothetical protein
VRKSIKISSWAQPFLLRASSLLSVYSQGSIPPEAYAPRSPLLIASTLINETISTGRAAERYPRQKTASFAYHLHYAVKNAVKCRKTPYFTPSCAKKRRFLRRN